jgi:DNA-binding transcriptional regulator YiaG
MTFQPLPHGLSTKDAAHYLNRQPQTLRKWAAYESGPIRPLRINGRLMWRVADLQGLLGGAQPA